tara:strand:- start:631 stop:1110 length:480 start_codon:yes stop_codon:yes gene_type:complete
MIKVKVLIKFIFLISFLSSCGGPGSSTNVPQAKLAGPTSIDIGRHIIYFSAQPTKQIAPEVAEKYNIKRSSKRAMLNISIIQKSSGFSVMADITIEASNMTGQIKNIELQEIQEPSNVVFYIGNTNIANREVIIFNINIKPENEEKPAQIKFERQFYID